MEYQLKRVGGALLEPIKSHSWESRAVFNPGTVRVGDAVHMLYRAVEGANFSTIGYARLDSAGNVLERRDQPVICREWDVEKQGVEDPRIVPFDGSNYIFYTAYDGAHPERDANTRVMMAETKDFCSFSKLGVVGPPGIQDKDAFIFPERVFLINCWSIMKDGTITDTLIMELLTQQATNFNKFIKGLVSVGLDALSVQKTKQN